MRRGVRLPLEQLAPYLLPVPKAPARLDWRVVFGNAHPVEIEIGFGKGSFLLTGAMARRNVNFLGVEIERKYQLFTANRIGKRGLSNVRLVCADARNFLRDCVTSESVHAIHVYFPDPWWKRRHHKRRLWTPEFAGQCERILKSGGRLHVATDVGDYFAIIAAVLVERPRMRASYLSEPNVPAHDLDFITNFERKSLQAGKPVYRSVHEKLPARREE
ncbi:MAG TPA: tRNA (guanosine(46)-N7)-methyltransferase TrmB [Gemmataceae bacterium]|nr:tRNA (guanosine(46)-N7)-methyltransferase TrmB [Gemmataceae bacterium]